MSFTTRSRRPTSLLVMPIFTRCASGFSRMYTAPYILRPRPLDVPLTQIDCTGWLRAELHTPAQPAQSMKRGEGSASSPPVERQDLPIRGSSLGHQLLYRLAAVPVVRDVVANRSQRGGSCAAV